MKPPPSAPQRAPGRPRRLGPLPGEQAEALGCPSTPLWRRGAGAPRRWSAFSARLQPGSVVPTGARDRGGPARRAGISAPRFRPKYAAWRDPTSARTDKDGDGPELGMDNARATRPKEENGRTRQINQPKWTCIWDWKAAAGDRPHPWPPGMNAPEACRLRRSPPCRSALFFGASATHRHLGWWA